MAQKINRNYPALALVPIEIGLQHDSILITEYFFTGVADEAGLAVQNDGTVFCTVCGKTLANIKTGKNHFYEVHQTPGMVRTATCSICKAVVKKRSIYMHYKVKHGVTATSMKNIIRL